MFSDNFVTLLQKQNLTAYKVAKATGISQGTMNEYKNGIKVPGAKNIQKIAEFLGVSVDELLGKKKAPQQDTEKLENVVIYHRDGNTVTKKLSKEQMDMLAKMIDAIPEDNDPQL